jgi:hypothetical protein
MVAMMSVARMAIVIAAVGAVAAAGAAGRAAPPPGSSPIVVVELFTSEGGRTLAHSAVVRSLRALTQVSAKDHAASATFEGRIDKAWNADHLRIVALLQEQTSHRIIGAGVAPLMRGRP